MGTSARREGGAGNSRPRRRRPEGPAVGGERGAQASSSFYGIIGCKIKVRACPGLRSRRVTGGRGLLLGGKVFFLLQSEATFSTLSAPPPRFPEVKRKAGAIKNSSLENNPPLPARAGVENLARERRFVREYDPRPQNTAARSLELGPSSFLSEREGGQEGKRRRIGEYSQLGYRWAANTSSGGGTPGPASPRARPEPRGPRRAGRPPLALRRAAVRGTARGRAWRGRRLGARGAVGGGAG